MNIPIIVLAYNREDSLKRLLNSLSNADYNNLSIELIISIDKNENSKVYDAADNFNWKFGQKRIIKHAQKLGLRKHIISCGDIVFDYDAIIVLEDDLYVSRSFYKYAIESVSFYKDDSNISGISLYSYRLIDFSGFRPFIPIQDDSDTYFVQVPSSWGQIWTVNQWSEFKEWYDKKKYSNIDYSDIIPISVIQWPESSWKKYFHMSLSQMNKYFVYPKVGFSTNMGDKGTHNLNDSNFFQSILMNHFQRDFVFKKLSDRFSVKYDSFFESLNIIDTIYDKTNKKRIIVDFYNLKKNTKDSLLLTTKRLNYKIVKSWALELLPYELNIINDLFGKDIFLYDLSVEIKNKTKPIKLKQLYYEMPGINREKALNFYISQTLKRIKIKFKNMFKR